MNANIEQTHGHGPRQGLGYEHGNFLTDTGYGHGREKNNRVEGHVCGIISSPFNEQRKSRQPLRNYVSLIYAKMKIIKLIVSSFHGKPPPFREIFSRKTKRND
jgi:hypothetical protein